MNKERRTPESSSSATATLGISKMSTGTANAYSKTPELKLSVRKLLGCSPSPPLVTTVGRDHRCTPSPDVLAAATENKSPQSTGDDVKSKCTEGQVANSLARSIVVANQDESSGKGERMTKR